MLGDQPLGLGPAVGQGTAAEDHAGAVRSGALDLRERRGLGHHDRGRDAEPGGVVGDALGMVAGRHRDDAPVALFAGQPGQLDQGTALLERTGVMLGLELQRELAAEQLREAGRVDGRRPHHRPGDDGGGVADVVDTDRKRHVWVSRHGGTGWWLCDLRQEFVRDLSVVYPWNGGLTLAFDASRDRDRAGRQGECNIRWRTGDCRSRPIRGGRRLGCTTASKLPFLGPDGSARRCHPDSRYVSAGRRTCSR